MGPIGILFLIDIAINALDMDANDHPFASHYADSDFCAQAVLIALVAATLLLITARSPYATRALVQRDKPPHSNRACLTCLTCALRRSPPKHLPGKDLMERKALVINHIDTKMLFINDIHRHA